MRRLPTLLLVALLLVLVAACSGDDDADTATDDGVSDSGGDGSADEPDEPAGPQPEPDDPEPADPEPAEPEPADPEPADPEPVAPLEGLALETVADGFSQPIDAAPVPGTDRLVVVERTGTARLVDSGSVSDEPFLDLGGIVNANSIEQGLLGITFHPEFPEDPRVFAFHSLADNDNVLVSYEVRPDGTAVDPDTRNVLLTVDKEPDKVRHNGGRVLFGPDGLLYVSLGDAARASVNGQDPTTLPGTVVRLDVDADDPYAIPSDNPFADGSGGAPEVWWYGLRNPWRFTIDVESGLAYVADVGQETIEEVNVVPFDVGGVNFGWPAFEGTGRFYSSTEPVGETTEPVLEVRHDDTDQGCSISGGVVYRGSEIPELDGHYLYADWCFGWIRSFLHADGEATEVQDWSDDLDTEMVAGFVADADGEVLVIDSAAGAISRIIPVR